MSSRVRAAVAWATERWPGRIILGTVRAVVHLEIFDRAMTLAAQLFTSIFPLLIMMAALLGSGFDERIAELIDVPVQTREVLSEAVGGGFGAFGIVGGLVVLVSTTGLARAFVRTYAVIWDLPRPRSNPRDAWRWLLAVVVLAAGLIGVQVLTRAAPLTTPFADVAIALFLPWMLTARRIPARHLLPGALLFAIAMQALRPVSAVYLPHSLEVSEARFGSIGVAFTYIGWLYIVSFVYLGTAAAGQVIATDPGRLGRLIRGESSPAVDGDRATTSA
ncbi:YihY/virulence factor BrkB family protein [Paractinoplanes maris]|uniref:YihY/virulence factor BrkB family protein n=1 Tax=Paractinoplanes maris TaxID=1734446 RepID=UPI002020ED4E|nr:YihY/virulence factor BrkB family protein [Actinoplanes maris]